MDKNPDLTEVLSGAYEEFADSIYRHCRHHMSDAEKAEELTQDCFMRTWEYLRAGKKIENMRTFLYRVANNLIVDEIRRRKRKDELSLDALQEKGFDPGCDDIVRVQEKLDVWKTLLEVEAEKDVDLLVMRYLHGMRPADIAQKTGVAANTVAVRLHRIVKNLTKKVFNRSKKAKMQRETSANKL